MFIIIVFLIKINYILQVEDWLRVRSALKKINEKKEKEKER